MVMELKGGVIEPKVVFVHEELGVSTKVRELFDGAGGRDCRNYVNYTVVLNAGRMMSPHETSRSRQDGARQNT